MVRLVDGGIADVSTLALLVIADTFITEASPVVCGIVRGIRATVPDPRSPLKRLWRWEGGEEGRSEHVIKGASCSIVRRWSDA